ncbi:MAG: SDR family NAD(P)-dependent oxidoreductase [Anaerolineales bacterium]|nr:SDR family NAD(P)-dependent oxidoreductase [Anaerolineales bacterium]MCB9145256.1 SDR family NAD(P)-dependent oxidoreductase [Anaerolineales bacterium]
MRFRFTIASIMNLFPIPLKDKVVLITGASSGFGQDAALQFAQEGCKVILAARRIDRLQALADKIQDAGGEAIAVPLDIVNSKDIDNMVQTAIDLYGHIDILFNNAGIGRSGWFEEHDPDRDIDLLIKVNLIGPMRVTRMVLPHMIARREGHIINMVSAGAFSSPPLITSYSASKFGLRSFTNALRRELFPLGIKVSGIYPGPASTEFGQGAKRNTKKNSISSKFGKKLTSEYVARRVVDIAKRPRKRLIIPWQYHLTLPLDTFLSIPADWGTYLFSKFNHKKD